MPDYNEQTMQRLENQRALEEAGFLSHPYRFDQTHHAAEILERHAGAPPEQRFEGPVAMAGRLMSLRRMGKVTFAHLQDQSGRLQVYFSRDLTAGYEHIKKLDMGDIVGLHGQLFTTRTGEITLEVVRWEPLVKSMHPLPDKWHGIKDIEVRYRQRYLDLIVNPEVRQVFRDRSRMISLIRQHFAQEGFLEVEGPTLHEIAGGTEARPFKTFHHALGHEFNLRIALELHLKRLLVGGFEKVFEIGRNYRNEGISPKHNPEFTMLEAYWAYADYHQMASLLENLIYTVVTAIRGQPRLTFGPHVIELTPPFARIDFVTSLQEKAGLDFDPTDLEALRRWSDHHHPELRSTPSYNLLDKLFGIYVEPTLIQPTFVMDVPLAISPLVKKHRSRPNLTERTDLFMAGFEIAPIYSELNDALDQRQRFTSQLEQRMAGDEEIPEPDEDFLLALEYGMPPAAGLGFGIDRFAMLLTDQHSIRDVLLFPLLKPRKGEPQPHDNSDPA